MWHKLWFLRLFFFNLIDCFLYIHSSIFLFINFHDYIWFLILLNVNWLNLYNGLMIVIYFALNQNVLFVITSYDRRISLEFEFWTQW